MLRFYVVTYGASHVRGEHTGEPFTIPRLHKSMTPIVEAAKTFALLEHDLIRKVADFSDKIMRQNKS